MMDEKLELMSFVCMVSTLSIFFAWDCRAPDFGFRGAVFVKVTFLNVVRI